MNQKKSTFYKSWIFANGISEAVGLGGAFVLGFLAAPMIESGSRASIVFAALLAVVMGTILEGVVVGIAQHMSLRTLIPGIRPSSWITATAIGAGLAWLMGMIPSTVMGLMNLSSTETAATEPSAVIQYGLAVGLGLVAGPILGVAQMFVLRRHVSNSSKWLIANAFAWAIGMPIIFMGMEFVPWNGPLLIIGLVVSLVCFVAGAIVGAVHGGFLLRLVQMSRSRERS